MQICHRSLSSHLSQKNGDNLLSNIACLESLQEHSPRQQNKKNKTTMMSINQ